MLLLQRMSPLLADFVVEIVFKGRVASPRVFWPNEAIVWCQLHLGAAALRHRLAPPSGRCLFLAQS
jgi:hypothetical protein